MANPELSVIIPVLNEAETLPLLLSDLAVQQDILFETLVVDGGSADESVDLTNRWLDAGPIDGQCLVAEKGRGKQLNTGINHAHSAWLLLLHADSRLLDPMQLRAAMDFMAAQTASSESINVAGRFALKFDDHAGNNQLAYYYYESKARLGRPGSIHGDQGMLISKTFYTSVGPFREDLPVMEDTLLAEHIRERGHWCLLPGDIVTSTRRFQSEGLKQRQTLNALMMNFLAIGWYEFFAEAPRIYRQQSKTQALQLKPFFDLIAKLLGEMPIRRRWQLWLATGAYVRGQAWQIALWLDCREAYRQGHALPHLDRLKWCDKWFERVTDNCVGRFLTAILVRCWFMLQRIR